MASGYTNRTLSARYPTDLEAWQQLKAHYSDDMRKRTLAELFRRDRGRAERLTLTAGDLVLDYSKNHVNAKTLKLLFRLARQAGGYNTSRVQGCGTKSQQPWAQPLPLPSTTWRAMYSYSWQSDREGWVEFAR